LLTLFFQVCIERIVHIVNHYVILIKTKGFSCLKNKIMSFYTCPKIDLNAERSEISVLKTREFFSKRNGFVSHEVNGTQDYGVDIYAQLIEDSNVSGGLVPVQIKSAKKGQGICKRRGNFISLKFSTSRLGHLCRHVPYYGIIIFYDEDSDILYFDYVWEIYKRVMNDKKDDSWKNNKYIYIHFPIENILESNTIENIREIFIQIYYNNTRLVNDLGINYDIPVLEKGNRYIPFKQKHEIIKHLEEKGADLFNRNQYKDIILLLEELSIKEISSKELLLFLAAVSYTEVGKLLDAEFYLTKCFKNRDLYNEGLMEILELQKIKVDFAFGKYNDTKLLEKLYELKGNVVSKDNIATIDHLISMLQLGNSIGNTDFEIKDIEDIEKGFETIENTTGSEKQRYFQRIFQSELLLHAVNRLYADYINNSKLYPFGETQERIDLFQYITDRFQLILDINKTAIIYSKKNNTPLIEAHAKNTIANLCFAVNYSHFFNQQKPTNIDYLKNQFEEALQNALDSHNLFQDSSMLKESYLAIRTVYDLYRLSEEALEIKLDYIINIEQIKEKIEQFSDCEFYSQHNSTVDFYCSTYSSTENTIDYSDKAIEQFSFQIVKSKRLPIERVGNLKNELINCRNFNKYCKNKELMLLTVQRTIKDENLWENPTLYQIINSKTGNYIIEGSNILDMLQKLGEINPADI